jgi:hypothetical protein
MLQARIEWTGVHGVIVVEKNSEEFQENDAA